MDVRYLVITYSTRHDDDIGPVLAVTKNYIDFKFATSGAPIPMYGYLLLEALPVGSTLEEAERRFKHAYVVPERERTVGSYRVA